MFWLEDLIFDADPGQDLHVILDSPGGDGETAIRIVRSLQARCRRLTIIVPEMAKSAATLIALGAHCILMGPISDLGPIDPQFRIPRGGGEGLVAGKDIVAAVDSAMAAVSANPDTYTLHASLLADVDALLVQSARTAIARTDDLLLEALRSHPDRGEEEVQELAQALRGPLIEETKSHAAPFNHADAERCGLPVVAPDPRERQWQMLWRLWAKYAGINAMVYEGETASQLLPRAVR